MIEDSITLEVAVLSLFINNPELVLEYQSLPSDIFSSSVNKSLFEVIKSLSISGFLPSFDLVHGTLASRNMLETCGGIDYLRYLKDSQYYVENLKEYISLLVKHYKRRRLVRMLNSLDSSTIPVDRVDNLVYELKNYLDNLDTLSDDSFVSKLGAAIPESIGALEHKIQSQNKIDVTTGFRHLDAITGGFISGDLWYVAGRPSMGKTAWCLNSINAAISNGIPSLIFSLEMNKMALVYRLLALRTGIPITNIRLGLINQEQLEIIKQEAQNIKELPLFIDTKFDANIYYIRSTARRLVHTNGIKLVHIDYLQLIDIADNANAVREFSSISRSLKVLANALDVTVIAYSQLNRLVELRGDKRPILSDLRESGGLEQDANVVLMLYRDVMYNQNTDQKDLMEFIIRKHREGPIGTLFAIFNAETNKIIEHL